MSTIRVVNVQHTDATEPNIVLLADGTSVFASGITISGGTNLTVSGIAEFASGTVSAPGVTFIDDNNTGLYSPAADTVAITTAAIERIRVDNSGNVGIGSANPTGDGWSAANNLVINSTGNSGMTVKSSGSGFGQLVFNDTTGGLRGFVAYGHTDDYLGLGTAGAERLRIDSSGNVGIGCTPQISGTGLDITGSTDSQLRLHTGNTGATTGDGLLVSLANNNDGYFWNYENNPLVFGTNNTERMRIDSSGNVRIGQTSGSSSKLSVYGSQLRFQGASTGTGESDGFGIGNNGATDPFIWNYENGFIQFGTNNTERMRIYSDGGVSFKQYLEFANQAGNGFAGYIGSAGLIAAGGSGNDLAVRSGQHLIFTTGGSTERMRITSSGNLLKGRTSNYNGAGEMAAFQGNSHGIVIFQSTNVNYTCLMLRNSYANNSGNNVSGNMITFHDNGGTERGKIASDGNGTSYIETSDYRLKENVVSLTGAIDRINELKAHRFNFIGVSGDKVDGFLAHEVQAVVPQAVTGTKDEVDEHGKAVMQGIDKSKLIPLLTAALQEAIAKIETLETEVAALKNN